MNFAKFLIRATLQTTCKWKRSESPVVSGFAVPALLMLCLTYLMIWKSTLTSQLKQINEIMNALLFRQTDLLLASCSQPILSQTQIQSS